MITQNSEGKYFILDYKTSKKSEEKIAFYQNQLNEYKKIIREVFNIENSNVNIKGNIKQVELDNDIKRDCIDKDIISEINFNNLKDNHGNDSKFENIKMMIDEGKSDEEICSSLSIGKGEVLLVRGLYNQ